MAPLDLAPDPRDVPAGATPAAAISGPSAPITLSAALCAVCVGESEPPPELAAAVTAFQQFWDDGLGELTELTVLAHASGHLGDATIDPFVERLREPIRFTAPLPLETEVDEERDATNARLDRLARRPRLRRDYAELVAQIWGLVAPTWQASLVPQARAAQRAWMRRLDDGEDILALFPAHHIVRRQPRFEQMLRTAFTDGRIRITPVHARPHIIALPGLLSVSLQFVQEPEIVARRRTAEDLAGRIRPLADPTRLTILAQLAAHPCGVGELARALHIAQPTASVHLRQLREAGLVTVRRAGSRSIYRAERDALTTLLSELGTRIDEHLAPR